MGQPSGGLHHSEGSRPLPHQAGKRLPPVGFENTHDSAVKMGTLGPRKRAHAHQRAKRKRGLNNKKENWNRDSFSQCFSNFTWSFHLSFILHDVLLYVYGLSWVFPRVSVLALTVS